ncbi:unnamed protein product [Symbiodinium necroappetens]|uniref:Uncharacterized protein n=1 Tax=Symbiodinium necroappetens TaxID=1628268 RepID=A0A812N0D8_9DINO|nr:unnamed protein product [Symbiodinium necroappetens]
MHTCAAELSYWPLKMHRALQEAAEEGSCADLEYEGDLQGETQWVSQKCCASFPASVCNPTAKKMTPCKDEADFLPGNFLHEWCEFKGTVPETCATTKGCHAGEGWCHCDNSEACTAAGGAWKQWTCDAAVQEWDSEKHLAVQSAATGSCEDVDWHGQPMSVALQHESSKCCASYPASVCDPTAKKMTPCKDEADFMPSNVLHEWCELNPIPNASTCASHGCHGDGSYCHCSSHTSCASVGGSWKTSTCAEDLGHKDVAWHQAVAQASDEGTCAESRVHDSTVEDAISWSSRKCCSSYPANACHKGLKKMTPCKDEADFMPSNVLHEWCEFHGTVPETCGTTKGCHAGEGWCHCDNSEACTAAGGAWNQRTCDAAVQEWDSEKHLAVQSAATGSCEDVDWHGQPMSVALQHESSKCCASYPASVCDPTAKKMTPCKDEADFMPSNVVHEYCELHGASVDSDTCTAHGCRSNHGHCHCDSQPGCEGVGGTWKVTSCEMEIGYWEPAKHKALQEAEESGTCGVDNMYGDLAIMIDHAATKCCASFPATLCDKTARHMTPCKDDADYTPEKEMYAWCDFYGDGAVLPEETVCNAQEGCYGGQGWCHCDGATGCQATGGIWNAHTCAKEVSQWSPEQHKMLQKADEHGTCLDLEVHGMRAQDFVNWPAQQCCKSFPASICDKDVKAMTPCLRSQDFDHNKTMWAWCEGLYPVPAEADCLAQGCTGNEHHCHCETAAACTALGGKYVEHQCWQDLQWMAAEVHKGIAKAIGQGTCEDVEAQHGKLEYAVDWLGGPRFGDSSQNSWPHHHVALPWSGLFVGHVVCFIRICRTKFRAPFSLNPKP